MVTGLEHTSPSLRMLRASAGRVAELIDIDGEGVDLVIGFSNRAAGVASARRLLSRGYRRFGYVGHDLERDKRAGKRFAGFRDTLLEAGCPLRDLQFTAAASSIEVGRFKLKDSARAIRPNSTRSISPTTIWRWADISIALRAVFPFRASSRCSGSTASISGPSPLSR